MTRLVLALLFVAVMGSFARAETFHNNFFDTLIAPDCSGNHVEVRRYCVPAGHRIVEYSASHTYRTCGSGIQVLGLDRVNRRCIVVQIRLAGCGYEDFLWTRRCKGEGRVDSYIHTITEAN